jgi:PhnB protein
MSEHPIPAGYPRVIPYLSVDGASAAIDFYIHVFGARERMRLPGRDGKIGHAELEIGDALIMLADSFPEIGNHSPHHLGGTAVTVMVYVEDVDTVFGRAIQAGASSLRPVEDQFYGDRSGQFVDPFGHKWSIASHIEDVDDQEMARRAAALAD